MAWKTFLIRLLCSTNRLVDPYPGSARDQDSNYRHIRLSDRDRNIRVSSDSPKVPKDGDVQPVSVLLLVLALVTICYLTVRISKMRRPIAAIGCGLAFAAFMFISAITAIS